MNPFLLEQFNIKTLFEDPNLIVISKPHGLLSQGEIKGDQNLVDILRLYFGRQYVGLVHRLDRNTSGLMVVAKRTKSAERLSKSLRSGDLVRAYKAWIHGIIPIGSEQTWSDLIVKDAKSNFSKVVKSHPDAKTAELHFKVLKNSHFDQHPVSLVEFVLNTGRSHQIRVQAAHRGYHLLGDKKYGAQDRYEGLALHSFMIQFCHPISGMALEFKEELPSRFMF